jgi:hypothetical protein
MKRILLYFLLWLVACQVSGQTGQSSFTVTATAIPDKICQGQYSQLSVEIHGGTEPFVYAWSPAATLSDTTIASPVATPLETTVYYVFVQDKDFRTAIDSVMVVVGSAPPPPSPVMGPSDVCSDTICEYSVAEIGGITSYSWTVPAGSVIISGQNTHVVNIQWGKNSGLVSVIMGNNCGTSVPSVLNVRVSSVPDSSAGIIGKSQICIYDTGTYYTDTIPGVLNYVWTIPPDASIIGGSGTHSILVSWGVTAGELSVKGENECGTGPPVFRSILIDTLPGIAGKISGPDSVCAGQGGYLYSISAVKNASYYHWILPLNAVITSKDDSNRISVEFGTDAESGPIMAAGINDCGSGQASGKEVFVKTCSGISEDKPIVRIVVSPNPASGIIHIHCDGLNGRFQVLVVNLLGEILYSGFTSQPAYDGSFEIDVSKMPKGMMYLNLLTERGSLTVKFIVH